MSWTTREGGHVVVMLSWTTREGRHVVVVLSWTTREEGHVVVMYNLRHQQNEKVEDFAGYK